MKKLKLVQDPQDPILRKKCTPVVDFDQDLKRLVLAMGKIMKKNKGIGLAAPQVGLSRQIIIVSTANGLLALINPKLSQRSLRKEIEEEGCLSCPEDMGLVKRSRSVVVKAFDAQGKKFEFKAEGLFARVIQHEFDHLKGILIIDKFEKENR